METKDLAFLLHQRHLSDSRVILELFTRGHGRVSVVWRKGNQQGAKRRVKQNMLQPFCLVECHYFGSGDLKTAKRIEQESTSFRLVGEPLYCGLYLNELLARALGHDEPQPELFDRYTETLNHLALCEQNQQLKHILRGFELRALQLLGYGIDFTADTNGQKITHSHQVYYRFVKGEGFIPVAKKLGNDIYSGAMILSIGEEDWCAANVDNAARRLCRAALKQILGDKPLRSRELYQQLQAAKK